MAELRFAKMHGLGNDFVVIDALSAPGVKLSAGQVRRLADRRGGVGADQVLLLGPGEGDEISYRIWNADGGEVAQCGNGARAAHVLLKQRGHVDGASKLRTAAGLLEVRDGGRGPRALLGEPAFEPAAIPLQRPARQDRYPYSGGGLATDFAALALGNPHALFWVEDVASAPVAAVGAQLNEAGDDFPRGVNVGFASPPQDARLTLRVHERGVGETPACGSGAAACAAVCFVEHGLAEVEIALPGGELLAGWSGPGTSAWIEGAVAHVFDGTFPLESASG